MRRLGFFWLFPLAAMIAAFLIGSSTLILLAVIWAVILLISLVVSSRASS